MMSPPIIPKLDGPGLAVAIAILSGIWFLFVEPIHRRVGEANDLRAQLADVEAMAISFEGSVRIREEGARAFRTELAALGVVLQPASQLNHRVQSLTELAAKLGVKIERVQPGDPAADTLTVAIPIKLSGNSTYPHIHAFLVNLRKQFPDVSVSGLRLQRIPAPLDENPPRATVEFDLAWHALPADSAGAARAGFAANP